MSRLKLIFQQKVLKQVYHMLRTNIYFEWFDQDNVGKRFD